MGEQEKQVGELQKSGEGISKEPREGVKKSINTLEKRLRGLIPILDPPLLYSHINNQIGNVEYLVAPDLAAGMQLSGTSEHRARQFLLKKSGLFFGSPSKEFEFQLFLKHVLRSQMGTHCVFRLRCEGREVEEHDFVVHLDHSDRVVMVSSVYKPNIPKAVVDALTQAEGIEGFPEESKIREILKKENLRQIQVIRVEPMWIPQYEDKEHEVYPGWQIKLVSDTDSFVVWLTLEPEGEIAVRQFPVSAKVAPERIGLGSVFRDFWEPEDGQKESVTVKTVFCRETKPVVLRDLTTHNELVGRYVLVRDNIDGDLPSTETPYNFLKEDPSSDWAMSRFDRVMAYYHIDLVQRFFRELGLDILDDDDYPQFTPMLVILREKRETSYCTVEQRIYFKRRTEFHHCTDAREARIVYHEFVHAVTEALARMRRHNTKDTSSPRYRQILEAEALDEGMADYFACSLAARYGLKHACFYPFKTIINGGGGKELFNLEEDVRELEEFPIDESRFYIKDEKLRTINNIEKEIIYPWGEQWSRYLWRLRCELGAEVADRIIAHSIFFLTRWSTFDMGILAIMLADRLLFDGVHKETILDAPKVWKEWDSN